VKPGQTNKKRKKNKIKEKKTTNSNKKEKSEKRYNAIRNGHDGDLIIKEG